MFTGVTKKTPDNLLLDAGAYFKNYDIASDTPETAKAKLIGATQGGGSFTATATIRHIEVDGVPGPVKGLERVDRWDIVMTANVKEVTADNMKIALAAASISTADAPAGYQHIEGKMDVDADDYVDNITWVGRLKGSEKPVIIVIRNALSLNGLNLTTTDKNEAVIAMTLTAHFDPDKLDKVPYDIYYPTVAEA